MLKLDLFSVRSGAVELSEREAWIGLKELPTGGMTEWLEGGSTAVCCSGEESKYPLRSILLTTLIAKSAIIITPPITPLPKVGIEEETLLLVCSMRFSGAELCDERDRDGGGGNNDSPHVGQQDLEVSCLPGFNFNVRSQPGQVIRVPDIVQTMFCGDGVAENRKDETKCAEMQYGRSLQTRLLCFCEYRVDVSLQFDEGQFAVVVSSRVLWSISFLNVPERTSHECLAAGNGTITGVD